MNFDNINIGSIWTMLVATAIAITYMFNTFVTAGEFEQYVVEDYYENYYRLEDRLAKAERQEDEERVREYQRSMERLVAKICKVDPEWIHCG